MPNGYYGSSRIPYEPVPKITEEERILADLKTAAARLQSVENEMTSAKMQYGYAVDALKKYVEKKMSVST